MKAKLKRRWPNRNERVDTVKVIKRDRGWVVRLETRQIVEPFFVKDGTLYTYWPDGRREIEITGHDLLGSYKTKRTAKAVAQRLQRAHRPS